MNVHVLLVRCLEHQMTHRTLGVLSPNSRDFIRHILNFSGPRLRGWKVLTLTNAAICFCIITNAVFFTTTSSGPGAQPTAAAADLAAAEGTPDVPGVGVGPGTLGLTAQWAIDGSPAPDPLLRFSLEIPTSASSSVSARHFLLNTVEHSFIVSKMYFSRSSSVHTEM